MIRQSLLLLSFIFLTACSQTNCLKTVAVSNLTITEAAKAVTVSAKENLVSVEKNKEASKIIKQASFLIDKAEPLCLVDKKEAFKLLNTANDMLSGI